MRATFLALAAIATALLAVVAFYTARANRVPEATDTYYSVVLTSGQIYYGKLQHLGSAYPELTDVFYIQSYANPDSKQVTNVLVRRGKEWHAPDRMLVNGRNIAFIEPVTANSQVARLIAEQKRASQPAAETTPR